MALNLPALAETEARLVALRADLRARGRLVVAYSGGVDSALLAAVAATELGDQALAVTAVSPSLAPDERTDAKAFAAEHGIRHLEVITDEGDREEYIKNDGDRCYHCKSALFDALDPLAALLDADVALGTIVDDLGDHRPGLRAAGERGVIAPLADAGFTKAEVRAASEILGLRTAAKPAAACLASRVAYGDTVTPEVLGRIARAESGLRNLGYQDLRVRSHGDGTVARIEVPADQLNGAMADRVEMVDAVTRAGFSFATLDLAGLRSGSMNVLLRARTDNDGRTGSADPHLDFATIDFDREARQGVAEVIYGAGKSAEEIGTIANRLLATNHGPVIATRVEDDIAELVMAAVADATYDKDGRTLSWRARAQLPFRLTIVTAGTTDRAVAAEAAAVAEALGLAVERIDDVGVAGLHRIITAEQQLLAADAVIVVAGMEGALASVVGGMVGSPVIAVPTSTGYGASLEGVTALLAMLSSCAAGVPVVNVDNGFGAAMAAYRLARTAGRAP